MTDYDFIIREPWLLDEYIMPALEKEMLIRLTNSHSGEMFPFRSVHELAVETLEYYKEQKIPFVVEVHGLESVVRMRFISLLVAAIGIQEDRHTTVAHDKDSSSFSLVFDYILDENDEYVTAVDYGVNFEIANDPAFVVELLGYKKRGSGFEYLTVFYDRQRQKHGFVRFTDADYLDIAELQVELMLQYLSTAGTSYDIAEKLEGLEPDEEP